LTIDPLEQRHLLSVTAGQTITIGTNDVFGSTTMAQAASTVSAQSVATDDNGDTAVTWTAQNVTYDKELSKAAGDDVFVYDTNVYAEYLTHNTQELSLATDTYSFDMIYGGTTITQTLSLSSATPTGTNSAENIEGEITLQYDTGKVTLASIGKIEGSFDSTATSPTAILSSYQQTVSATATGIIVDSNTALKAGDIIRVGSEDMTVVSAYDVRKEAIAAGAPAFLVDMQISSMLGHSPADTLYACVVVRDKSSATAHGNGEAASLVTKTMMSAKVSYEELNYQTFADQLTAAIQVWGGQFADATVTATDSLHFKITYDAATGSDGKIYTTSAITGETTLVDQIYLSVDQENTEFTAGYLPAATIQTTSVPVVIGKVYVSPSNATKTAVALKTYLEGQTESTEEVGPTGNNSPEFDVDLIETGLDVSITSVTTSADPRGLYHFYVTFNGTAGYEILDKLTIVNAKTVKGVDVTEQCSVSIIKQSSGVFRVNPTEVDDPFSYGLDLTNQYSASAAMDADGDFIISWISEESDGSTNIYARRFSSTMYQEDVTDCWSYTAVDSSANYSTTYVQCVVATAAPADTELYLVADNPADDNSTYTTFQVNTIMTVSTGSSSVGEDPVDDWYHLCSTSVAMDGQGNFVIGWSSQGQNYSYFNRVYVRQFNADGSPIDVEKAVTSEDADAHGQAYVALSDEDTFVVMYVSYSPQSLDTETDSGDDTYISASSVDWKLYKWDGSTVSSRTQLNWRSIGLNPTAMFDSAGNFLVSWDEYWDFDLQSTPTGRKNQSGVYSTYYDSTGWTILSEFRASSASLNSIGFTVWPGYQGQGQAAIDADGDITVTFEGFGVDVSEAANLSSGNIFAYIQKQLNDPANAALLKYIDPAAFYSGNMDNGSFGLNGDVDSLINAVLAFAQAKLTKGDEIGELVGTWDAGTSTIIPMISQGTTDDILIAVENGKTLTEVNGYVYLTIDGELMRVAHGNYTDVTSTIGGAYTGYTVYKLTGVERAYDNTVAKTHEQKAVVSIITDMDAYESADNILGRLNALLDGVLTKLRGDANGIIYSQLDANRSDGSTAVIVADATANSDRDGSNQIVDLVVSKDVNAGGLVLRIGDPNDGSYWDVIVVPVFYTDGTLNANATTQGIHDAIESAWPALGEAWKDAMGCISVRLLTSEEITARQNTDWEVLDGDGTAVDPDTQYVYEITFLGSVHDTNMSISIFQNTLTSAVAEVQTVTFSITPPNPVVGTYTAVIWMEDATKTQTFTFDSSNPTAVAQYLAAAISQLAAAGGPFPGGLNVEVKTLDGLNYTVTFSGVFAGVDQVPISGTISDASGNPVGVIYATTTVNGADAPTAASMVTVVNGNSGTEQHDASIGMQSNGSYVIAYTQDNQYTDGENVSSNSIMVQSYEESTDTAGPSLTALEMVDGTQILDGRTVNTTKDGLAYIVLDFSEALYCYADVETQLNALGYSRYAGTKVDGVTMKLASQSLIAKCQVNWEMSVLNRDNYSILVGGEELSGAVVSVSYGLNQAHIFNEANNLGLATKGTNKYQVVITLDGDSSTAGKQALTNGDYTVVVKHYVSSQGTETGQSGVCDAKGNALGLTGYTEGTNGVDMSMSFSVLTAAEPGSHGADDPATPDSGDTDTATNATTAGEQNGAVVATAYNGSYVIAWASYGQDGDGRNQGNIIAQRYADNGTKIGGEFVVNSYTTGDQGSVAIAMNDNGSFVIVWYGEGSGGVMGVYGRTYNSNGVATSKQFLVGSASSDTEKAPSVAIAADGSFVVVWTVYDVASLDSHILGRCYTNTGNAGAIFQVDSSGNLSNGYADVAMDKNGNFVVVWQSFSTTGGDWDIYGQRFLASGLVDGDEFVINTYTTDKQVDPSVAISDDGKEFIVSWSSYGEDVAGSYGVYARIFDATGKASNSVFLVNTVTAGNQFQSDVACDASGNFTVVWASYGQDYRRNSDYGIYARMYFADGTDYAESGNVVGVFRVNATTSGNQVTPAVSRNIDNGDYVVVWVGPDGDDTGIFFRRLDPETKTSTGGTEEPVSTTPTISISDALANEVAGSMTFTITLSDACDTDVTVHYSTADGTATAGSDFIAASGTAIIKAGSTSTTVTVAIIDDTKVEATETFTVTLSEPSGAEINDGTATGMIVSDDALPSLSISNASANEADGTMVFTVTLSAPSESEVTVRYYTAANTATAGSDYTTTTGTLTIAAGQTSATIAVPIVDDTKIESNETFKVTLASPTNATIASESGVGTIVDDDAVLPTLTIGNASASEKDGTMTFTVTLSSVSASDVTVNYATAAGTATAGSDFTAKNGTLTIAAGSTTGTITVAIVNDGAVESVEDFTVVLSDATHATIVNTTGTGAITSDDVLPTLTIGNASASEAAGTMTFNVTLSEISDSDVTVGYTTKAGAAAAGSDYSTTSGTLTIKAGSTSGVITVAIVNDAVYEGNETFSVVLSNPTNATIAATTGTGTIVDDDTLPMVSINNASAKENAGVIAFTVTLSKASESDVTVYFSTTDGTAVAGSDYTEYSGSVVIAAGQTSAVVNIALTNDTTYESNETFLVGLSSAAGATVASGTGTVTIIDDDPLPTLSVSNASATEAAGGKMTFTVTLSQVSASDVTVQYAVVGGTATGGDDYLASPGTLTIKAGETTGTFTVFLIEDSIVEGNEDFTVRLSNATNATIASGTGTGTIIDNDSLPTLSINNASAKESAGKITFTVTLSAASESDVTVNYVTAGGTATAGADYTSASGTLTIKKGETTGTITIDVANDTKVESNEMFTVTLSSPTNATIVSAAATGTIVDEDTASSTGVAVYNPATGIWSLKNSLSSGDADLTFGYGAANKGWLAFSGDWDGDGDVTVGMYDPTTSTFFLKNDNAGGKADVKFVFGVGNGNFTVIVGDWDGDGKDTIALYSSSTGTFRIKNSLAGGKADVKFDFGVGNAGWTAIAGDWDGDGKDTIGLYNASNATLYLKNSLAGGKADVKFVYGGVNAGFTAVAGDWDGDGVDTVGLYSSSTSTYYLRSTSDAANGLDTTVRFGTANSGLTPVIGDWTNASALHAAGGEVMASANATTVTQSQLSAIVSEAVSRWKSAGLSSEQIAKLESTSFTIANLSGSLLGEASGTKVTIDSNAAGYGWYVDSTPSTDTEFTAKSPEVANRVDLLTVVEHELGHVLGLDDNMDALAESIMDSTLATGVRESIYANDIAEVLSID
jgi:hypothetical protein